MAQKKFDGVIEAVRYIPEGKIDRVRVFLRRGAAWSDLMLMTREDFIAILKTGKRIMSGKRVPFMAGTFDVTEPVQLQGKDGQEVITLSKGSADRDHLEGVPLF
jgi:hypothetical protein